MVEWLSVRLQTKQLWVRVQLQSSLTTLHKLFFKPIRIFAVDTNCYLDLIIVPGGMNGKLLQTNYFLKNAKEMCNTNNSAFFFTSFEKFIWLSTFFLLNLQLAVEFWLSRLNMYLPVGRICCAPVFKDTQGEKTSSNKTLTLTKSMNGDTSVVGT